MLENAIKNCPLFFGITSDTFALLKSISTIEEFHQGELILKENQENNNLYLILSGNVEVIKRTEKSNESLPVCELFTGDPFGEISFATQSPASTSIFVREKSIVAKISRSLLEQTTQGKEILSIVSKNITKLMSQKIQATTTNYISLLEKRIEDLNHKKIFSGFFTLTILLFCFVIVLSYAIEHYDPTLDVYSPKFGWFYLSLIAIPLVILAKRNRTPLKELGLTLENWQQALYEGLAITVVLTTILLSSIWLFVHFYAHKNIFDYMSFRFVTWKKLTYLPHSFLQEFIARGVLLTSLRNFYTNNIVVAVLLSSMVFSVFHVLYGLTAIAVTFIGSIIFSCIYLRHENLISVTIVHVALGYIALLFKFV